MEVSARFLELIAIRALMEDAPMGPLKKLTLPFEKKSSWSMSILWTRACREGDLGMWLVASLSKSGVESEYAQRSSSFNFQRTRNRKTDGDHWRC